MSTFATVIVCVSVTVDKFRQTVLGNLELDWFGGLLDQVSVDWVGGLYQSTQNCKDKPNPGLRSRFTESVKRLIDAV